MFSQNEQQHSWFKESLNKGYHTPEKSAVFYYIIWGKLILPIAIEIHYNMDIFSGYFINKIRGNMVLGG